MNDAIVLAGPERQALALLLAARQLIDADDWLEWEDVPLLDEEGHSELVEVVQQFGTELANQLTMFEHLNDIDAHYLHGRVS